DRRRLQAQAAGWGAAIAAAREASLAEILAFHYREAAVLYTAIEPGSETTELTRDKAAMWLLKAADAAVSAAATPEAVRHIRASIDLVAPPARPRLHERIGDLTAGEQGV